MSLAQQKAVQTTRLYQTNDPYRIAELLNIQVIDATLAGRLKELYFGDHIILRANLSHNEKRHFLAHALGHHFMHTGNYLFFQQHRYLQNDKEEMQAEEFAAHLLVPDRELEPIADSPPAELASFFQVSEELITLRLKLMSATINSF